MDAACRQLQRASMNSLPKFVPLAHQTTTPQCCFNRLFSSLAPPTNSAIRRHEFKSVHKQLVTACVDVQSYRSFAISTAALREKRHVFREKRQLLRDKTQMFKEKKDVAKEILKKYVPKREDIYTLPNLLTTSRLLVSPMIGYFIVQNQIYWAMGAFAWAGVSDLLDGFIARRWNQKTMLGTMLDPLADKVLMTVLTVSLSMVHLLPVPLAILIIGRDVGLTAAGLYYRWISLPQPVCVVRDNQILRHVWQTTNTLRSGKQRTLSTYFDPTIASVQIKPTRISKYNTFLQLLLMGATLTSPLYGFQDSIWLTGLQVVVAITTVWSGVSYAMAKDVVKLLRHTK